MHTIMQKVTRGVRRRVVRSTREVPLKPVQVRKAGWLLRQKKSFAQTCPPNKTMVILPRLVGRWTLIRDGQPGREQ